MTVSFQSACGPISLEPLAKPLRACAVAGSSFGQCQRQACADAGLSVVERHGDVSVAENAWVAPSVLLQLCETEAPCVATSAGKVVAFRGCAEGASIEVGEDAVMIRYPWDFLTMQERLLSDLRVSNCLGAVHERAVVDGVMVLGKGSRILPGVYIEGVAVIGENCKIGPNAYLRGCTSIGDRCHVGQAVEIKNSIVYSDTAIGHLSYCGDSIIGEGVNFGAGTIISNYRHDGKNHRSMIEGMLVDTGRRKFGAIVGDGVHTGIHSSIYPGRKIWPHAMTLPGEIVCKDIVTNEL